ncbi:MAG TPA: rod shape-determining protein MreD [Gaiellaceae bacterium]|nr:rod shape-determining protein MreD [Gaiellaceae bacterium]
MIAADAAKAAGLLFVAVVLQVSIFSQIDLLHGRPQLLLVAVICVALLRGAVFGAVAGFGAGLLADTGYFGMLGFTSLLLTLAGYWVGRYGETTGRDRAHAPLLSVTVVTVLYQFGALILHFVLGQPAPAREVLLIALVPTMILNLALTVPVHALVRRVVRKARPSAAVPEVRLLA